MHAYGSPLPLAIVFVAYWCQTFLEIVQNHQEPTLLLSSTYGRLYLLLHHMVLGWGARQRPQLHRASEHNWNHDANAGYRIPIYGPNHLELREVILIGAQMHIFDHYEPSLGQWRTKDVDVRWVHQWVPWHYRYYISMQSLTASSRPFYSETSPTTSTCSISVARPQGPFSWTRKLRQFICVLFPGNKRGTIKAFLLHIEWEAGFASTNQTRSPELCGRFDREEDLHICKPQLS